MERGPLRGLIAWAAAACLLVAAAALLAAAGAHAQTEPPATGDWVVIDSTAISNRTVDLYGNLTVKWDGRLTLQNVTLRVHSASASVLMGIRVEAGSRLFLIDNDRNGSTTYDRTLITRGVPSIPYTFLVEGTIYCENSAIFGAGAHGTVGGVEVRGRGPGRYAVFNNTTISSGHDFCLGLIDAVDPVIANCVFTHSDGPGVLVVDSERVGFSYCTVASNGGEGIRFENVTGYGLLRCNVSSNALAGLDIVGGSDLTVRECRLLGNLDGIVARGTSALLCENVTVDGSRFWGVRLLEGCGNVTLRACTVSATFRDGVLADDVDGLAMVGSMVNASAYNGLLVQNSSSNVSLERCTLRSNGYSGAKLDNSGGLRLEDVRAGWNGFYGVWFVNSGSIGLRGCDLRNNTYDGMYSDHSRDMEMTRVLASGNGYSGVDLAGDTRNASVRACRLTDNAQAGLLLSGVEDVEAVSCNLSGNGYYGLRVEGASRSVRAELCRMEGNGVISLVVEDSTAVVAEGVLAAAGLPASAVWTSRNGELLVLNSTVAGRVTARSGGRCTIIGPLEGSNVSVSVQDQGSSVMEGWWLSAHLLWPAGGPVEAAAVKATSRDGLWNASATTGADGWARWMPLIERTTTSGGARGHNPYRVVASKDDAANGTSVDIVRDTVLEIVLRDGEAPVAVASDVVAELGLPALLDGSLSSDNVAVVRWDWSFGDGVGTVVLEGPVVNWTFTVLGRFEGSLVVSDAIGLTATARFNVTVVDTIAPVVSLGGDRTVPQGTTVELDGTGTRDNDPSLMATASFTWVVRALPSGTPQGVLEGPFKTWEFRVMGPFTVTLSVRDSSGNVGQGAFNVTVLDTTPPTVNAGPDRTVDERATVVLEPMLVADNDPSFDVTGHVWWVVDGQRLDGARVEWTAARPGVYVAELHARDAAGNEATSARNITVRDRTPPAVEAGGDRTVQVGTEVALSAEGTTDNDPAFPAGATFRWTVSGPQLELARAGPRLNFTPPWIGRYIATVVVTDASGNAAQLSIAVESVDTVPPDFSSFAPGPAEMQPGTTVTVSFDVTDSGTGVDPGTLEVRTGEGMGTAWGPWRAVPLASGGALVHVELPLLLAEGWDRVQLRVSDVAGNGPVLSTVHYVSVNSRPVARIVLPREGAVFGPYDSVALDGRASSDPDANDTLRYMWTSSIDGPLGDAANRTVARLSPGRHLITLEVTDGLPGHASFATVNITVEGVPREPRGGSPAWVWLLAALLIAATVVVVAYGLARRRGAEPPAPPRGGAGARAAPPGPDGSGGGGQGPPTG